MTYAEFRVYDAAYEEAPIWELTWEGLDHTSKEEVIVHPALPREDAASALLAALERGDVMLYETVFSAKATLGRHDLEIDQAVKVIGDPDYWMPESAPAMICLFITDAGEKRAQTMKRPELERRPRT
jgi:hypothetical protein